MQHPLSHSRTMGRIAIDTCCWIDLAKSEPVMLKLVTFREQGFVELVRSDLVDQELSVAYHNKSGESFDLTSHFVEMMGPAVLDDSRIGHVVSASEDDIQKVELVRSIIFGLKTQLSHNDKRDVKHLVTAIRYGCSWFVTRDNRLLKYSGEIKNRFELSIVTPVEALGRVQKHVDRFKLKDEGTQW
jgi:predicted nucleic acid-binding protein